MSKDSRIQDELSSSMTGGRLRRYAKVTSAMGGLAARLAGERYLGIKILTNKNFGKFNQRCSKAQSLGCWS